MCCLWAPDARVLFCVLLVVTFMRRSKGSPTNGGFPPPAGLLTVPVPLFPAAAEDVTAEH